MGTRAIIAVRLEDGSILASNVAYSGGDDLAARLWTRYGDYAMALGLVVLGDLLGVDEDGTPNPSPVAAKPVRYANLDALDAGKLANANHVHLFDGGTWQHLVDDEGQFQEALAELID